MTHFLLYRKIDGPTGLRVVGTYPQPQDAMDAAGHPDPADWGTIPGCVGHLFVKPALYPTGGFSPWIIRSSDARVALPTTGGSP